MTTTYQRIRFLDGDTKRTVILMNPTDVRVMGMDCVSGIEVNKNGQEVAPQGADERLRILAQMLIISRTDLVMSKHYGELEEQGITVSEFIDNVIGTTL